MIDSHVHCWDTALFDLDLARRVPRPAEAATPGGLRTCPPGTRAVSSVVLVEASARPGGATEAAWLAAQGRTRSMPSVAGIVASLPLERSSDVAAELDSLLEAVPLVCGIRRNLEAMPPWTSCDGSFRAGVAVVGRRGLPFDLCASGPTLDDVVELAAALPEVRFVLDHVGKPPRPSTIMTRG